MAKPIKETPILMGKDAVMFLNKVKASSDKKASPQEIAKMKENFSKLNSIVKR